MTARTDVRNSAEKPPTATRVAGSEPLTMTTPRSPLPQPLPADCMFASLFGWRSSAFGGDKTSDNPVQFCKTVWIWKVIRFGWRDANERSRRDPDHRRDERDPRQGRRPRALRRRPPAVDPQPCHDDGRFAFDHR